LIQMTKKGEGERKIEKKDSSLRKKENLRGGKKRTLSMTGSLWASTRRLVRDQCRERKKPHACRCHCGGNMSSGEKKTLTLPAQQYSGAKVAIDTSKPSKRGDARLV